MGTVIFLWGNKKVDIYSCILLRHCVLYTIMLYWVSMLAKVNGDQGQVSGQKDVTKDPTYFFCFSLSFLAMPSLLPIFRIGWPHFQIKQKKAEIIINGQIVSSQWPFPSQWTQNKSDQLVVLFSTEMKWKVRYLGGY